VAPATFAVAAALLHERVPFAFFTRETLASLAHVPPILVPPGIAPPPTAGPIHLIAVPDEALDVPAAPSRLLGRLVIRAMADRPLRALARHYFGSARVRRAVDRSGLTARFLESPLFTVPRRAAEVGRLLDGVERPHVESDTPLLVERWHGRDGLVRLHLVNYVDGMATVVLRRTPPLQAWYSPDETTRVDADSVGAETRIHLETYVVLEWIDRRQAP
jgi:hypothetical protein